MSDATQVKGELVSIADAAKRLGISQEAVRKRVQRKQLVSVASPTGLMVELPEDFLEIERRALARQNGTDEDKPSGQDATALVKAEDKAITHILRRFEDQAGKIALLKAEVADLKEENKLLTRKNRKLEREVDRLSYGDATSPD